MDSGSRLTVWNSGSSTYQLFGFGQVYLPCASGLSSVKWGNNHTYLIGLLGEELNEVN